MSRINEQEAIHCLNALLSSYETLEALERIKHTTLYRHGLKEKIKLSIKELEPFVNQLQAIWGFDDTTMYNLMEYNKNLLKQLVSVRPEEKAVISEFITAMRSDLAGTMEKLGLGKKEEVAE